MSHLLDGLDSAGAGLVGACNHCLVHGVSCLAPLVAARGGNLNNADNSAADGSVTNIVTDDSWKVAPGPIVYDDTRQGEIYDARRCLEYSE